MAQIKKSPVAELGDSKDINQTELVSNNYHNTIKNSIHCQTFCIDLLQQFDYLIQHYLSADIHAFKNKELALLIALSNLDKSLKQSSTIKVS